MNQNYETLEKKYKKIHNLNHLLSMASWDEAAFMPKGGSSARAEAMAEMSVLLNQLNSDPEIADLVEQLKPDQQSLTPWQKANLREIEYHWKQANCIPDTLVEKKSLAASKCEHAWRTLRSANNWKDFAPLLEEVVKLAREEAQIRAEISKTSLYDALLDLYEPGITSAIIDPIFENLKSFLPNLIQEIVERQKSYTFQNLPGPFSVDKQKELGLHAMKVIGFNFDHGRLDVSLHPFCGGVPEDVRITTRYTEEDFTQSLMGVIHETGHASYEQGLPRDWISQPVGLARSTAMHESQSLLFEKQVGRSSEFLHYLVPVIQDAFPDKKEVLNYTNLHQIFSKVEPGFIRVDADEATYPAHIILRYEIEKDLIEGHLAVNDIPEVWNLKMKEYLNISTEGNFTDGCMQDIHWPMGAFGYFPTYTLGAMIAAQLFNSIKQAIPSIYEDMKKGQLLNLKNWLKGNVWENASSLPTEQLIEQATGEALNPNFFKEHLEERYLKN